MGELSVPETGKEKASKGEIIAVGQCIVSDDGTRLEMDVKVGDKVLYGKYSGTNVTLDGELTLTYEFDCSRCADPVPGDVKVPLHLAFVEGDEDSDDLTLDISEVDIDDLY